MRRLYADREEKRVTRGSDISGQDGEQEQLDVNYPNQRSLIAHGERRIYGTLCRISPLAE